MNRSLLLFSIILSILTFLWNHFLPESLKSPHAFIIILYFYLSTQIVHYQLMKTNAISPKNFVRAYMGFTAGRLFLNLIIIMLYILINKPQAIVFTMAFLVFYFLYLIFEVASLQKQLGKKQ